MEISANFAFLKNEFPNVAEGAGYAEQHVYGDPRASCFHARHALETLVKRIYKIDKRLSVPPVQNLDGYLTSPEFREIVGETVWQKAEFVRRAGNGAVHARKMPSAEKALAVVEEFFHVAYWAGRTYLRHGADQLQGKVYDASLLQKMSLVASPASIEQLEALQKARDEAEEARKETEEELAKLRARLEEIIAANADVPDTHDWSEAKTRERIIDLDLRRAGWLLEDDRDREYQVTGMPNNEGVGYVDYVLWGDDGKPLAVVEAKRTTKDAKTGQQQAKLYADCLEKMHGQRPIIFYTNGYTTYLWDDEMYPERKVAGFYTRKELAILIHRRQARQPLLAENVKQEIAGRYYQKRAIGSISEHFEARHRKALLVMATGTGKTRTAIALVDLLQRCGWVKRALFLADRISLVNQAANAFKAHLPESSPVNLVTEKDETGRVYVSTYPTMMGLIDDTKGDEARFGVGYFDLIIIDEAHRSVYQKYGAIFEYFDSLLVGLTATPREQVDKNTYKLFGLPPGDPTDAYELDTAVRDGFLVPPSVIQVDLKFPREGIDYDSLSEAEQDEWESLDWGESSDSGALPTRVNASAINSWLFNTDTVDKALQYLMEHGAKVDGGDRLGKTILFARNHDHAVFIERRFNHHYPHHAGKFARVIDNYAPYAQSLLEDFSVKEKDPHLAVSVDMLDTGVDIPEVLNLVFFKPVYSKIKFWQMIGRGTRLCQDLFGPGFDKTEFRIFDFCFNFDFFNENPDGVEGKAAPSVGARIFCERVALLGHLQEDPADESGAALRESIATELHAQVQAMNADNFIVRMKRETVDRFRERGAWEQVSEADRTRLAEEVAGLPTELEQDKIESRLFDLLLLRMQVAMLENNRAGFEKGRLRVIEIASVLEAIDVPAVQAERPLLAEIQTGEFWEGITLGILEHVRVHLRGLLPLVDKASRTVVYTDFEDEIVGVRHDADISLPKMTGVQYEKRVMKFLEDHKNDLVIQKLRRNQPLTQTDLETLQATLVQIGEEDGAGLLEGLLARKEAPSLVHFIRSLVGFDRQVATQMFAEFLSDKSLSTQQIRFIEMVIEQLTARGVMEAGALYERPFTDLDVGGPEDLFRGKDNVIEGIFERLKDLQAPAIADVG